MSTRDCSSGVRVRTDNPDANASDGCSRAGDAPMGSVCWDRGTGHWTTTDRWLSSVVEIVRELKSLNLELCKFSV